MSNYDNILILGFADNKRPEFKEVKSKDWILFGEDNLFPYHLLYLYDKSSNHGAIINGKSKYIFGQGFPISPEVNAKQETLNKVFKKAIKDIEIFGGCYFQILWAMGGKATIAHIPFEKIRKAKDKEGYFYKSNWKDTTKKEYPKYIPEFDPNLKVGVQIFCYREYRPGCDYYPLPGYFSALNDIETDVEISKYNLSVIKNGMFSSKMIVFNNGEPTDEVKKKIEKSFKEKFAGSENSGRFMLVFNQDPTKAPQVQDLSTTDLDKLFNQLNTITQGEIFTGHEVTSPMLFGVKTEGQLGGRDEIVEAYEIFKNTYVNEKQQNIEEVYNFLAPFIGAPVGQKLIPVEPIEPSEVPAPVLSTTPVNDNMKNLTGRQYQNVERIIRKYKTGKIQRPMAETMLKSGLGLSDDEVTTFLNFASIEQEEDVAEMFSYVGKERKDYTIVKRKEKFNGQSLPEFDREVFKDIKGNDSAILDLIRKDKRITPEVIAKTINETVAYVRGRINVLKEDGVLRESSTTIGVDTIIEHAINPEQIDSRVTPETADVFIRYSYEPKPGLQPIIETTRPFCKRLIELDRLYTRSEIEQISQRVGFSVWDRKGGFWGDKEECRHRWVANIVIKRTKFEAVKPEAPELELVDLNESDFDGFDSFTMEKVISEREKIFNDLDSLKQLRDLVWQ